MELPGAIKKKNKFKKCFIVKNLKTYKRNSEFLHIMFTMILTLFYFILAQKDFDICLGPFFAFFLFLLQKDFDIFCVLLLRSFSLFFFIIFSCHFLMKKNYEQIFLLVLFICLKINFKI